VITQGTGSKAAVPGYRVAGKTGTAQKIDPETGTYLPTLSIASFVGYVPAEDPRLVIVVAIDEPQGDTWGGVVAAPVFRRVAEQALPYLGVSSQGPVRLALARATDAERRIVP
jgi:cell division protein FtsI (penicillin-binding protein 3)